VGERLDLPFQSIEDQVSLKGYSCQVGLGTVAAFTPRELHLDLELVPWQMLTRRKKPVSVRDSGRTVSSERADRMPYNPSSPLLGR